MRDAVTAETAAPEPRGRAELARCIADLAAVNAALSGLQWTRNKAALSLYYHAVAATARRPGGPALRVDAAPADTPIATHRATLDARSIERLRICSKPSLGRIVVVATLDERPVGGGWRTDRTTRYRMRAGRIRGSSPEAAPPPSSSP